MGYVCQAVGCRPTEKYSHSTHTGHRVDASHFHHNPPPLRHHTSQSESYLACLIDHDSLQPDIHNLYIQFILYIYRIVYIVYGSDISQYY